MKTKKVVWLSAFKHVIPADYENWLEEMALQGWNIDRIGQWSSIRLVFMRTPPKKYRYVYDIQPNPKKDYRATYEQFGWECVGIMASCFIWRKEYSDERPEAFSDMQSIKDRNKRVVRASSVSLFPFPFPFSFRIYNGLDYVCGGISIIDYWTYYTVCSVSFIVRRHRSISCVGNAKDL